MGCPLQRPPVVGSMTRATLCTSLHGNPPREACSRTPVLAGGDIDAEDLAAGDITVIPLDVAAHVGKNLVALLRDAADLLVAERSGPGQLAFDDEMGMSHVCFGASRDGRCGS